MKITVEQCIRLDDDHRVSIAVGIRLSQHDVDDDLTIVFVEFPPHTSIVSTLLTDAALDSRGARLKLINCAFKCYACGCFCFAVRTNPNAQLRNCCCTDHGRTYARHYANRTHREHGTLDGKRKRKRSYRPRRRPRD